MLVYLIPLRHLAAEYLAGSSLGDESICVVSIDNKGYAIIANREGNSLGLFGRKHRTLALGQVAGGDEQTRLQSHQLVHTRILVRIYRLKMCLRVSIFELFSLLLDDGAKTLIRVEGDGA